METKLCHKCRTIKPLEFFGKDKYRKDGLTTSCKSCRQEANRIYFAQHPEVREKHNLKNREKRKLYYQDPARKRKYKSKQLQYSYGITIEDYDKLFESQNGVCAICNLAETAKNNQFNGLTSMLAVDHCHTTLKIRGLLCNSCNKALGSFKDSIELLYKAINYLERNEI